MCHIKCFGWHTPYPIIRLIRNRISRLSSRRNRRVNVTHVAASSSRKSVFQLGRPWLPVASAGHSLGEEELEETRLWPPDAGGFLLHVPVRRIYRRQYSDIAEYGGRSEKLLHFLVFTLFIYFIISEGKFKKHLEWITKRISHFLHSTKQQTIACCVCVKYAASSSWSVQNIVTASMKWRLQGAGPNAETSGSTLSWAATAPVRMSHCRPSHCKTPADVVLMFPRPVHAGRTEAGLAWLGLKWKQENGVCVCVFLFLNERY